MTDYCRSASWKKIFIRKTQSFRFYFNFSEEKKLFPHCFLNDRLIDKCKLNRALEDHLGPTWFWKQCFKLGFPRACQAKSWIFPVKGILPLLQWNLKRSFILIVKTYFLQGCTASPCSNYYPPHPYEKNYMRKLRHVAIWMFV